MEPISFALSSVDYAIRIARHVKRKVEAHHQNPVEFKTLLARFYTIRKSLQCLKSSQAVDLSSPIWGAAFQRIQTHFYSSGKELKEINSVLKSNALKKFLSAGDIAKRIDDLENGVDALQRELDLLGFFSASNQASAVQSSATLTRIHSLQNTVTAMEQKLNYLASNLQVPLNTQPTPREFQSEAPREVETEQTVDYSNSYSIENIGDGPSSRLEQSSSDSDLSSRIQQIEQGLKECTKKIRTVKLSEEDYQKLNKSLQNLRARWRLDLSDLFVSSTRENTDGAHLGTHEGTITFRDCHGFITRIARAALKVIPNDNPETRAALIRQVFLLREITHPCLLTFYGAYWSHPTSGERDGVYNKLTIGTNKSAIMATELMTHNLETATEAGYVAALETKLYVLRDVARGLEYLHSRGVVHSDLHPKNILLRIVNGKIIGRVKIGGVDGFMLAMLKHREAWNPISKSTSEPESAHLPPEARVSVDVAEPSWDIWSFGFLISKLFSVTATSRSIEEPGLSLLYFPENGYRGMTGLTAGIRLLSQECLSPRSESRPCLTVVRRSIEMMCSEHLPFGAPVSDRGDELSEAGKDYLLGRNGRSRDATRAIQYFERALQLGNIPALVRLGDCFFYGLGVPQDVPHAIELYCLAASAGHGSGLFRLGECLYDGSGVEQKVADALVLFKKASDQGNGPAKYKLGCHYFSTDGEVGLAIEFWKDAANLGHHFAQFKLARCYEEGHGVAKDMFLANLWYSKSADQGHVGSKWALRRLETATAMTGIAREL